MKIRLLYFAVLRERLNREYEILELPEGTDISALLDDLERRHAGFQQLRAACKAAVNQEFVRLDRVLADGDEVALIPPVAGG